MALGYEEQSLNDGGSDRLIDDLVLQGAPVQVAELAGRTSLGRRDHVAIQLWRVQSAFRRGISRPRGSLGIYGPPA